MHSASGLLVSLAVSEGMAGQVPGLSTEHGREGPVLTCVSINKDSGYDLWTHPFLTLILAKVQGY